MVRLAAVVVSVMLLSACSAWSYTKGSMLISEGCVVYIEAITASQADELVKEWNIDGCELRILEEGAGQ